MKYYILIADIMNSTNKESAMLMKEFKGTINFVNQNSKRKILSPLTITLGDEFQGIIASLAAAIDILFQMEEYFLKHQLDIKLRYVLNYGQIDTKINKKIAYEMLGEGLTNARKNLNEMKGDETRFHFSLDLERKDLEEMLNESFFLYQSFVDAWKFENYKLAWEFISNKDYKIVAQNVNLDKSSAWRRKRSLHIKEYETIKTLTLNILKRYDNL
jgi:hypothetical protein